MLKNKISYEYHLRFGQLFNLFIGIGFLGFGLFMLLFTEGFEVLSISLIIVFSLLGILPIGLFFNYLNFSYNKKVSFDFEKNEIQITADNRLKTVRIDEIETVEIYDFFDIGNIRFDYNYAKYFTKEGNVFIVNNFMTKSYYIPTDIIPIEINKLLPIININTEKYPVKKTDYDELIEKYSELSIPELEQILKPENGYRKDVLLEVRKLLKAKQKYNKR